MGKDPHEKRMPQPDNQENGTEQYSNGEIQEELCYEELIDEYSTWL
jgi:hypothetical protein